MFNVKSLMAAFVLAFSTVTLAAPVATAQGTSVVVIDQARIMRDSLAGQDIQTKLKNIENSINAELKPTADQLNTEGKQIEAKTQGMTPDAMRADAALRTQVENYARKANDFARTRQISAQELVVTERKAWSDFYIALRPVLQEVVNERGAQIMMDRSQLVFTDESVDVTNLVIQKLNASTPTVAVVRQKVSTQPAQ